MISLLGERLADHGAIFQLASTMHHKYNMLDYLVKNGNIHLRRGETAEKIAFQRGLQNPNMGFSGEGE